MTDRSLPIALFRGATKSFLALAGVLALSACPAPTETITSGSAVFDLGPGERVVVYPRMDCLSAELAARADVPSRIMPTPNFQDSLFPWFEPGRTPMAPDALDQMLRKPHVRARIADLNVRYLIGIAKRDESDGFPGFFCGAGYGGGGCLGVGWENKETSLEAVIWDLLEGGLAGDLSAHTSGTSLAIGVAVPIIFVAYTEAEACEKMADLIARSLNFPSHR
jgi:hypothetical protein